MGKTYHKHTRGYEDEQTSGRSGKHSKHSNNRKTGGLKTLNSYVDEDYESFEPIEQDDIQIQDSNHTT
jgi:hypothetical protein